jgi:hypothetical protein
LVCTVTVPFGLFTVVSFFTIIITTTHINTFTLIGNIYSGRTCFTVICIGLPITTADRSLYVRTYLWDFSADTFTLTATSELCTKVSFITSIIPFTHICTFTLIGYTNPGFCSYTIIGIGLPITTADRSVYIRTGIRFFITDTSALTIPNSLYAKRTGWAIRSLLTASSHKKDYGTKKQC